MSVQISRADRALLWKESYQLVPLVSVLIATGLFLMFVGVVFGSTQHTWESGIIPVVPFMLPALYCVGAPAVLVSQGI